MTDTQNFVQSWLQKHREEMFADWRTLVDIPSHVSCRAEGEQTARLLTGLFEGLGMEVRLEESGPDNAPTIIGLLGADRPGKPVLFSGHYDMVDLTGEHPFRFDEEGRVRGLGCLDMKGGIVVAIWTVKALQALGWAERPIKFLFAGDEETGHKGGVAAEILRRESAGCLCAFNMETGLVSNSLCIGRKGTAFATITTTGVASHSGNDFLGGRNAIVEMAAKIPAIQALTNLEQDTTVSCNVINGGTVVNGIPGSCSMQVDARYPKQFRSIHRLNAWRPVPA